MDFGDTWSMIFETYVREAAEEANKYYPQQADYDKHFCCTCRILSSRHNRSWVERHLSDIADFLERW